MVTTIRPRVRPGRWLRSGALLAAALLLAAAGCGRRARPEPPEIPEPEPRFFSYSGSFPDEPVLAALEEALPGLVADTRFRVRGTLGVAIVRPERLLIGPADGGGRPGLWEVRQVWDQGLRTWRVDLFAEPLVRGGLDPAAVVLGGVTEAILADASDRSAGRLPGWVVAGAPLFVSGLGDRARRERIFGESPGHRPDEALTGWTRLRYVERVFGPRRLARLVPAMLAKSDEVAGIEAALDRPARALALEWSLHEAEGIAPDDTERAALAGDLRAGPPTLVAESSLRAVLDRPPSPDDLPVLDALLAGTPAFPVRLDLATYARARCLLAADHRADAIEELRRLEHRYPESPLRLSGLVDLARIRLDGGEPAVALSLLEGEIFRAEGVDGSELRGVALRASEALERDGLAEAIVRHEIAASGESGPLLEAKARIEERSRGPLSDSQRQRLDAALRVLRSPSATERERAAARRIVLHLGRRCGPVLGAIAAEDDALALEAVRLLDGLGGDEAVAALQVAALGVRPDAAAAAVRIVLALGADGAELGRRLDEEGATEAAREAFADATAGADAAVLAAVPDLAAALSSPDIDPRIRLASRLGDSGLAGALAPLRRLLADPEPPVRRAALAGCAGLGEPGWPEIERVLREGRPEDRVAACAVMLEHVPDRLDARLPELAGDAEPVVRAAAARALARRSGPARAELLVRLLGDEDPRVREVAAEAIASADARATAAALVDAYAAGGTAIRDARIARLLAGFAGRDFGHRPGLTPEARAAVVEAMRVWLAGVAGE